MARKERELDRPRHLEGEGLDELLDARVPHLLARCRREDGAEECGEALEAELV